jgi:glycine/D-amino acid oxidase-like deaminating enzyme
MQRINFDARPLVVSVATYDLIVAGAGIVGAFCAWEASMAGLRVAIVEPGSPGGASTAAGMGHLVVMDDDPAEFALSRWSLRLWKEHVDLPEAEYSACGTLWVAENEDEIRLLAAKATRLVAAGIAAESFDARTLRAIEPALATDLPGGLRVPADGVVYPPRLTRWLVERVRDLGGAFYAGRQVHALEAHGVRLDDGTRLSGPVLIACGCATPTLLPELPVRPRKGHLVITDRYASLLRHEVLEVGYAASAHGDADSTVAFNAQPRPTGQILIGSSREYGAADAQVSPPMLARMLERAFRFVPALRELKAVRAWTGFRPATPDGLPWIGAVPDRKDVWVAAGHEGLGVTTATGSARLVVDLMLGRALAIDPRPYAPARASA